MAKVQIVGRKRDLEGTLDVLPGRRRVELAPVSHAARAPGADPAADERARRRDRAQLLLARLDGLLKLAAARPQAAFGPAPAALDEGVLERELDALAPLVEELSGTIEELRSEQAVLGRYVTLLERLLELVPELRMLGDRELGSLRLTTVALVLGAEDERIVDLLREALEELLGDSFWLVSAPVDEGALGCVLLHPREAGDAVRELLGQERIRHVPLPEEYVGLSIPASVESMRRRLGELPRELERARGRLAAYLAPHVVGWQVARSALAARVEQLDALALAGETERAFVLVGWTPRAQVGRLEQAIERGLGVTVLVEELPSGRRDPDAPVLVRNRPPSQPFQPFVAFFDTPRARSIDPTALLALFLPLMFGLMVGDVVYGVLLLVGAVAIRRRFASGEPVLRNVTSVMIASSLWAIVFGFVFGEALGNLGAEHGMEALWIHRDSEDAVVPLLVLALAIGAVHLVLGLLLGLWQSWRDRSRSELAAHAGTLVFLAGSFVIAGVAADRLPSGVITPAVAALVVGLVMVSATEGALGAIIGPLEMVGAVTNVLSYLRLAAVGLASVYLALVANELAGVGPIWMGVLIATLLHGLNLALAGFTPAVQALRLQYVEFFGKFFVGGGRPFRPFGAPEPGPQGALSS
ncbi:MAG: V-type ATP synthase subunit I [Nocardioidaceae bacterium]